MEFANTPIGIQYKHDSAAVVWTNFSCVRELRKTLKVIQVIPLFFTMAEVTSFNYL